MDNNKKRTLLLGTVFLFVLIGLFVLYLFFSKKPEVVTPATEDLSGFPSFNPIDPNPETKEIENPDSIPPVSSYDLEKESPFQRLTDFAVAGAVFFEESRPVLDNTTPAPEVIKTIISPNTKAGRQEIQKILNDTLDPSPKLTTDGAFGPKTVEAIKKFQETNNLSVTGKIDNETNQFFFTTSTSKNKQEYENVPLLRYVEKASGHIYEMDLKNKTVSKVSNTTIPKIHEAFFDKSGKSVIYRYLSDNDSISSYLATLGATTGEFLPANIIDLSLNPNKDKFFYLTKTSDGVVGSLRYFGQTKKDTFFNFPYTEWLSQYISDQKIYLTTKPSWATEGHFYSLNKESGVISKIFGNIQGLTTLVDNNGNYVLYNSSTNKGPQLNLFNINKNSSIVLNAYGLPEKCAWSKNGSDLYCALPSVIEGKEYPDSWYQGLTSFNDYFVLIDTQTNSVDTLANTLAGAGLDATHLFLDKNEETLFFINKKDSTLWSLSIF
jgi:peptidoglycan hydrolase-like protein with peptidoglycan-binding domain